ncbi:MAG: hypothetical protein IPL49_12035 [Saprospirales bacterium]|nr:hypothetical protein [Saprospirales bacterium]
MQIAVNARFLLPGKLEGIGWYTYEVVRRMAAAHPEDTFLAVVRPSVRRAFSLWIERSFAGGIAPGKTSIALAGLV